MTLRSIMAAWLAAFALTACAKTPLPEPVVVTEVMRPAPRAAECDPARDPKWRDPPDRDLDISELARINRENRGAFHKLAALRAVCHAGEAAPEPPAAS